jgi:2',3'-cyclic-nucleotide 2'-phosphodiesterase (5'-nucleotidase family)
MSETARKQNGGKRATEFTRQAAIYAAAAMICALLALSAGIAETGRKPDLIVLLTGDTKGFLEDCGCQRTAEGGIARRAAMIRQIREENPGKVLAVDAGRVVYGSEAHDKKRMQLYFKAMGLAGYGVMNLGATDLDQGILSLQENLASAGLPLISTNVRVKGLRTRPYIVRQVGDVRVALFGLTQFDRPTTDPAMSFAGPMEALRDALTSMSEPADVRLILSDLPHDSNRVLAYVFRGKVDAVLGSLEGTLSDVIADTTVARSWRYGRSMTRVDFYVDQNPGKVRAQVGQVMLPGDAKEDPAVRALLDGFYRSFELDETLAGLNGRLFVGEPVEQMSGNGYTGADACRACHKEEYERWSTSVHARAFSALLPTQRQYLPECLPCHTTGYRYKSGYRADRRGTDLRGVQCETCHGPGHLHALAKDKSGTRGKPDASLCRACHTSEKDPKFAETKMNEIRHKAARP